MFLHSFKFYQKELRQIYLVLRVSKNENINYEYETKINENLNNIYGNNK